MIGRTVFSLICKGDYPRDNRSPMDRLLGDKINCYANPNPNPNRSYGQDEITMKRRLLRTDVVS